MEEQKTVRQPRLGLFLAFFLADLLLLGAGIWIWWQGHRPLLAYEIAGMGFCIGLAGWFGVWPFILQQRVWLRLRETEEILQAVQTLQKLDRIAQLVEQATSSWQYAHDHASQVAKTAEELSRRMEEERAKFIEFLKEAHNARLMHLQLEVEKLRRAQDEWLQVTVFVLDHVHALFVAALRSGREEVIQQIGRFRSVVLDAVRRLGIAVVIPREGEPFSREQHVVPEEVTIPKEDAVIGQVLAPGYRFQGRMIRSPLVIPVSKAVLAAAQSRGTDRPAHGTMSASLETGKQDASDREAGMHDSRKHPPEPEEVLSMDEEEPDPFEQTEPVSQTFTHAIDNEDIADPSPAEPSEGMEQAAEPVDQGGENRSPDESSI